MPRDVVAVAERAVRLRVNGLVIGVWSCSPDALEDLAVGRLLAEGFVTGLPDLLSLRQRTATGDVLAVDAEVAHQRAAAALEERAHRAAHGCGPRYLLDCRRDLIDGADRDAAGVPDLSAFPGLFRLLYEGAGGYRATGGLHTAALATADETLVLREEVGRHNAVDKVIGAGLREGHPLRRLGLVTTARISGEMAGKAARAGLGWIASRSVPTTLAVEIAGVAGLPIIARAAGRDATVFGPA